MAAILRTPRRQLLLWFKTPQAMWETRYQEYQAKIRKKYIIFVVCFLLFAALCFYLNLIYEVAVGHEMYEEWIQAWVVSLVLDQLAFGVVPTLIMGLTVLSYHFLFLRPIEEVFHSLRVFRTMRVHH